MDKKLATRLKEIAERGLLYRVATVANIDKEARTVELSFSSETEKVERWFGIEVLGHNPDEVDLSRLNNGAPLLWMHNTTDQRGVVVAGTARIDADRKGRCTAKYSRSEEGEKLFQDIVDGIVTKVSVGYNVLGMRLVEERDGIDVYRVTAWQPYEISNVSVPADDDVGVGRAAANPQEETNSKTPETPIVEQNLNDRNSSEAIKNMEKILRDASGNLVRAKVDDAGNIVSVIEVLERAGEGASAIAQRGQDAERARVRELTEIGKAYGANDLALEYIGAGKTGEDMRRELLARFQTERAAKPLAEQAKDANIGLTDKEVRTFSIMKAIRAMANPENKAFAEAAKFEFEASRAAADLYGKNPKGIIIPNDVLAHSSSFRAFSTTNPSGGPGANLVATELLAGSFIELLRKKAWVMKRCRSLGGLVGNIDIPRQNAANSAYWVGEGGAPTTGQIGVDQIHMSPKTLGATTDITRRLMMQSTPDAEMLVRDDLLKIMALEIDRVAIYGSGTSNQPSGLNGQTGINSVSLGVAAQPSFIEFVSMETKIALANADVDSMSYAFNAGIRGFAKTTLKFPGVNGSQTIWEQGNTINGYATDTSNQIASGDVFFGNWQDLIIAMWGGLELTVDPYSLSTSGGLRLVALQDIDTNIRHVESFTVAR
jgi:HK97 family phage major capsid protein/HK97 family phage prohead protease